MIGCDQSSKSQSFSNGVIDEEYVDYDMQQLKSVLGTLREEVVSLW